MLCFCLGSCASNLAVCMYFGVCLRPFVNSSDLFLCSVPGGAGLRCVSIFLFCIAVV